MNIARERYQRWQDRHAELTAMVDARHGDWIGPVVAFADEVIRDCRDVAVTGPAKLARSHAANFREAKSDAKLQREYESFLFAWTRLDGMFCVHLNAPHRET